VVLVVVGVVLEADGVEVVLGAVFGGEHASDTSVTPAGSDHDDGGVPGGTDKDSA
jgi:hypothetical protein